VPPPADQPGVRGVVASELRRVRTLLRRVLIGGMVLALVALAAAVTAIADPEALGGSVPAPTPVSASATPTERSHPQVVEPQAGVADADPAPASTSDARAPSDAQIRSELRQLKELAAQDQLVVGSRARVLPDGRAVAPQDAPPLVRDVIRSANVIAKTPYLWGGGHGSWSSVGYDCSGSVSFALAGAGLLDAPLTSGELAHWGAPGPGRWITIYANDGHVFMVVAGLRFDTGALPGAGTRWQATGRDASAFTPRHPGGL
jgi:cell wall-associated NlpC family hydrolase